VETESSGDVASATEPTRSEFDTEHFGISIARHPHLTRNTIGAANEFCQRERIALLITRCPTTDTDSLLRLQADGFRIVDTLVRWRLNLSKKQDHGSNYPIAVRSVGAADTAVVADIARAAFSTHTGHYHADPRLNPTRSTDLYVRWAVSACQDTMANAYVLGAEWLNSLAGFVTLESDNEIVWNVSLAAVAPSAQGHGLLTALLSEAGRIARKRGGKFLEYGCVLTNIGAQKALVRLGFEIHASYHTLHKWF
jgi:GNAT superfamily N-acetyltransferase